MQSTSRLEYEHAHEYAMRWAKFDHDDLTRFHADGKALFGTLGTLEFQYLPEERILHVWVFIMPGANPSTERGKTIKATLDRIAQEHPEETAGAVFDIRTLPWNMQASPDLEPCLWLRHDISNGSLDPEEEVKQLKTFSRAGYIWHRQKIDDVLADYWREHPKPTK